MRGYNICFHREIRKIIFELSSIPFLIWMSAIHLKMFVFQYLGFSTADKGQGRRAAAEANQKNITEGVTSAQSENEERDALLRQVEPRDLIDFGMIPEFVGRMPIVVPFQSLTEEMLVKILTEPKNALVAQFKASFILDNVSKFFFFQFCHIQSNQSTMW